MARHLSVRGNFDSATKLQYAKVSINLEDVIVDENGDEDYSRVYATIRIRGRKSAVVTPYAELIQKAYQSGMVAKAQAERKKPARRRRFVSRGLLTAGR